jgi:hypothetical protein
MTYRYLLDGLFFALGVALVGILASSPMWLKAFAGEQPQGLLNVLQFVGTPIALAAVGFWWGAVVVELRRSSVLALFLAGALFAGLSIPVLFALMLFLDGSSPLLFGVIAAVGAFFWAPVFHGLNKSANAS